MIDARPRVAAFKDTGLNVWGRERGCWGADQMKGTGQEKKGIFNGIDADVQVTNCPVSPRSSPPSINHRVI